MFWIQQLDQSILDWIHTALSCPFLNGLMPVFSLLGEYGAIWILAAVILLCTRRFHRQGILILLGLFAGLLIGNLCLKPLVARLRPFVQNSAVELLIVQPSGFSFPSGHTLSSTIAASLLCFADRRFALPACLIAFCIAFSRLYLYVHFPTDVLGAILIGVVIACVLHRLARRFLHHPEPASSPLKA